MTEIVNRIESLKFVLGASFIVNSEKDLVMLMELFQKADGGIWGAHSFDGMIEPDIRANSVLEIIEYDHTM